MGEDHEGRLTTGVPGLDDVLGGGLWEGDSALLIGPPGSGKTTLVFQLAFHAVGAGRSVVYVSTLSEPASQLLKHLRSFSFWQDRYVGDRLVLQSIEGILERPPRELVQALTEAVDEQQATMLIVDGLASLRDAHPSAAEIRSFTNELGVEMAARQCTTILTSSAVTDMRAATSPEFTICDAVFELEQRNLEERGTRSLRAWKVRGRRNLLGRHAMRIAADGISVFPRFESLPLPEPESFEPQRTSSGSEELDGMMQGGIPRGSLTVIAGGPGTGKTLLGLQFLLEGVQRDEPGLLVSFREGKRQLVQRARSFGHDLSGPLEDGRMTLLRWPPVDLEPDEVLSQLHCELERTGARRLVIDSVGEIQQALPEPGRRRSVLAALRELLHARGVTAAFTRDISQIIGPELDFADSPLEMLAENVVLLRYVEFHGELARIISVLKMRQSAHDRSIRQYRIEEDRGLHVLERTETAEGLLSGIARLPSESRIKRTERGRDEDDEHGEGRP